MNRLLSWLPPVLWMVVILVWLSSDAFSAEQTEGRLASLLRWILPSVTPAQIKGAHTLVRTSVHVAVYGLLAGLWLRAFVRERVLPGSAAAWAAFAITVAWACVDELNQSTMASREGSALDVATDAAGAAVVLLIARFACRRNGRGNGGLQAP